MKFCCDDVSFESLIIMIADKNLISLAQEWERVKGQAMPTTSPHFCKHLINAASGPYHIYLIHFEIQMIHILSFSPRTDPSILE